MTTYDVTGHLTVKVRLGRGRLDIASGPPTQADATVTALDPTDKAAVLAAQGASIDLADGQLTVELPRLEHRAPPVLIVITLPAASDVRVTGGDVDVTSAAALGDIRLRLGNGVVQLGNCDAVDVKAGNLDLTADCVAELQVAAGNAHVSAVDVGSAGLRVGAGSLTLASSSGQVTAKGGQVELTIASTASGDVDFRAAAGSATIGVAPGTGVHLDLISALGDVSSALPVAAEAPEEGAALSLRLHTGAGDLRVHRAGEEPAPSQPSQATGFPDIGRIVESTLSRVQRDLDSAGLSGIRIDVTGDRSRPRWAEKLEKVVRKHAGTTRTHYVGPLWGTDGEDVTENRTWLDGVALPVDDAVSEVEARELRAAGYDGDLVAQLPVEGPWSVAALLAVCRAGLAEVVSLAQQLPVAGPFTAAGLAALAEDGLADIVRRIRAADLDGPVDPDDVLPRFGSAST